MVRYHDTVCAVLECQRRILPGDDPLMISRLFTWARSWSRNSTVMSGGASIVTRDTSSPAKTGPRRHMSWVLFT
jgi:hypothetical protein